MPVLIQQSAELYQVPNFQRVLDLEAQLLGPVEALQNGCIATLRIRLLLSEDGVAGSRLSQVVEKGAPSEVLPGVGRHTERVGGVDYHRVVVRGGRLRRSARRPGQRPGDPAGCWFLEPNTAELRSVGLLPIPSRARYTAGAVPVHLGTVPFPYCTTPLVTCITVSRLGDLLCYAGA